MKGQGRRKAREVIEHVAPSADVSEAQARGKNFGEGPESEGPFRSPGSQGLRRRLVVPEFAVGLVLHKPEVVFTGFVSQKRTALFGHRKARGIRKRRHHVGKASTSDRSVNCGGVKARGVRGQRFKRGHCEAKRLQGSEVRGVFNQNAASFIKENACGKVQSLLRARNNLHFFRLCRHALRGFACGDEFSETRLAFGEGVLQCVRRIFREHLVCGLFEFLHRKPEGRGQAPCKGNDFRAACKFQKLTDEACLGACRGAA